MDGYCGVSQFASYRCHLKHHTCIWRVVWASVKSLMCLAVSFEWFLGLSSSGFLCTDRMQCKKVSNWLKWRSVFECACRGKGGVWCITLVMHLFFFLLKKRWMSLEGNLQIHSCVNYWSFPAPYLILILQTLLTGLFSIIYWSFWKVPFSTSQRPNTKLNISGTNMESG